MSVFSSSTSSVSPFEFAKGNLCWVCINQAKIAEMFPSLAVLGGKPHPSTPLILWGFGQFPSKVIYISMTPSQVGLKLST